GVAPWANARLAAAGVMVGASRSTLNAPLPVAPSSASADTEYWPLSVSRGGDAGSYGSSGPPLIWYLIAAPGWVSFSVTGPVNQPLAGVLSTELTSTGGSCCGGGATNPVDLPLATATLPAASTTCTE